MTPPPQGRMEGVAHRFPLRVYYEDTDAGGIVYHANYLRFAERARTEMLRCLGFPHQRLIEEHQGALVVSRLEIEYALPARLDDALEVRTWLTALGGASLKLSQHVMRAGDDPVICARIKLRLACVSGNGRPSRLPDDFTQSAAPLVTALQE
jgi:acyl-CoA thioester hydrolase